MAKKRDKIEDLLRGFQMVGPGWAGPLGEFWSLKNPDTNADWHPILVFFGGVELAFVARYSFFTKHASRAIIHIRHDLRQDY